MEYPFVYLSTDADSWIGWLKFCIGWSRSSNNSTANYEGGAEPAYQCASHNILLANYDSSCHHCNLL
jgi:hypothetical protein